MSYHQTVLSDWMCITRKWTIWKNLNNGSKSCKTCKERIENWENNTQVSKVIDLFICYWYLKEINIVIKILNFSMISYWQINKKIKIKS